MRGKKMTKQFVIFELNSQTYAIEIEFVNEITNACAITPIPNCNPVFEGIVNLRGVVVPLLNLNRVFGNEINLDANHQIIIVNTETSQVGFIIGSAKDVKNVEESQIEPISDILSMNGGFISGTINIENEIIQLISVNHILSSVNFNKIELTSTVN